MSSNELMIGSLERKFLEELQHNYNQLASESKKKYPHVKEACETGIIRVRNASTPAVIASSGFKNSLINESAQMMEPFFMGCDTKAQKLVQISLNAIQKSILFECLNVQAATNLINCLWNLMEHGLEEVKVLQTITLLITTNQLVKDELLAKTMSMCFRLHYTKNQTTNNTASATIRQLTTVIFERIQTKTNPLLASSSASNQEQTKDKSKLFEIISNDDGDSCRYVPVYLKSNSALDAFNLIQDLIQIVNGESPFWIKNTVEISKIFGLELLELIIDRYPQIFFQYEEFTFVLKEKVCQLVIKLFSPNIKQRSHLSLNPLQFKQTSTTTGNNSNNSSNPGSAMPNSSIHQSTYQSQTPIWSITVRLMRIVSVLIKNFFEILITESEIFLSLLVKSLEVDKFNWQRLTALESLYKMIQPKILSSLCKHYDMNAQSSKILRDIVNALCIFIQSQFQVVDSSTTQSLIASLVNNNNSGNTNINTNITTHHHASNQSIIDRTNINNGNGHFPMFSLRGISTSLLFNPMDKDHRYKPFYIDQLDKQEAPTAPEGHGLSTAVACVFEIVTSLTRIIENDLETRIDTKTHNNSECLRPSEKLDLETVKLHKQMLVSSFHGLVGTFSLLLDASVDEVCTELVLDQMRKLIVIYGLYEVAVARDALLISMSKSSLPSNYYSIPALNPDNLQFDEWSSSSSTTSNSAKQTNEIVTNSATASSSAVASASVNLFSLSSVANNASINLPNLLSQQNSHQQTALISNPKSNLDGNQLQSSSSSNTGSSSNDVNKQIIAVGTPLPNNFPTSPSASNTGSTGNNSGQQGPVMLTSKNLQCMSSIMHVSMTYSFVYEEKSWHIVFTTLQHLVWILGMKPNNISAFKLSEHYSNMSSNHSMDSNHEQPQQQYQHSNSNQTSDQLVASCADLPVLTAMLSRLFECTQNISDESLITMMKALITLSNEAMEVAFNNREPSLFSVVKIHESSLVNLKRIDLLWDLITGHLIQVSSHPYNKLRECGVEVLCNLVKSVLNYIYGKKKSEQQMKHAKKDMVIDQKEIIAIPSKESYYLMALEALSEIKFIDIRQKQIECLLRILQSNGEDITDGWPIMLNIIESACIPQNEKLIVHSFQCYEFIVSNLLRYIPSIHLIHCINAAVSFGSQLQELNVSLSAVGLIWNVADFLFSNHEQIQSSIEQFAKNGHKFVNVDLPFCENLTPLQSLWISLFKNLSNLCTDARLSVRKSSVQTLMSTLSKHGQILDYNTWKAIFFYVLFPLVDSVRTLCSLASNKKITHSESSKPNSYGDNSEYMIHYSRNTAFKQWCETQVSVINGISRILSIKLDMLITYILTNHHDTKIVPANNNPAGISGEETTTLNDNETILMNIWSLFFEFIYASSVCANTEVSMSAIKCFNEIINFLNEYQKNKTNAFLGNNNAGTNNSNNKKQDEMLAKKFINLLSLIWKIVWKTWCNIGHHVSVNKVIDCQNSNNNKANNNNCMEQQQSQTTTANNANQQAMLLPSQSFLCLLINPLFIIFSKNLFQFTENDFKNMSFILQNVIAIPFDVMTENMMTCSYHHQGGEHSLTNLQHEVMNVLEKIQEHIINNLTTLNHLLPLLFYQYLAFSLYSVNIVPPNLNVFISSQFQHRFLPGGLTTFKSSSFYIFGEIALKNAFNLYHCTYAEAIVIKSHILHSMIKAYKIPLCFKYSCPLQTTWKYAVNYFIKTVELGLPLARKYPNDFISIWADLALTFDGFLFPVNKPPTNQKLEEQQIDEALDVKVVELIRDHIMIHAQKIPKEFLLQIVSILNRGSIHSPSITSIESEINRKLREDFARICFQTLLQFSFFGPKGNPDLFIQSKTNLNDAGGGGGSGNNSPEQTIGIVNKLAVASILKRFNDVIIKYVEDEQLCPCPLPRHRLSEISFVLKALATLISSLKEAPAGVVEAHVWQQLIDLYPRIVDCTMSNSPQVNNSIREVLHQYACLLQCPRPPPNNNKNNIPEQNGIIQQQQQQTIGQQQIMKSASKSSDHHGKTSKPKQQQQNGNNEINI